MQSSIQLALALTLSLGAGNISYVHANPVRQEKTVSAKDLIEKLENEKKQLDALSGDEKDLYRTVLDAQIRELRSSKPDARHISQLNSELESAAREFFNANKNQSSNQDFRKFQNLRSTNARTFKSYDPAASLSRGGEFNVQERAKLLNQLRSVKNTLAQTSNPEAKDVVSGLSDDALKEKSNDELKRILNSSIALERRVNPIDRGDRVESVKSKALADLDQMKKDLDRQRGYGDSNPDWKNKAEETERAIEQARAKLEGKSGSWYNGWSDKIAPANNAKDIRELMDDVRKQANTAKEIYNHHVGGAFGDAKGSKGSMSASVLAELRELENRIVEDGKVNSLGQVGKYFNQEANAKYELALADIKDLRKKIGSIPNAEALERVKELRSRAQEIRHSYGEKVAPTAEMRAYLDEVKNQRDFFVKNFRKESSHEGAKLLGEYNKILKNPPPTIEEAQDKLKAAYNEYKATLPDDRADALDNRFRRLRDTGEIAAKRVKETDHAAQVDSYKNRTDDQRIDQDFLSAKRCDAGGFLLKLGREDDAKSCPVVKDLTDRALDGIVAAKIEGIEGTCGEEVKKVNEIYYNSRLGANRTRTVERKVSTTMCDPRLGFVGEKLASGSHKPLCVSATVSDKLTACAAMIPVTKAAGKGRLVRHDENVAKMVSFLKGNRAGFLEAQRQWTAYCSSPIKTPGQPTRASGQTCSFLKTRIEFLAKELNLSRDLYQVKYSNEAEKQVANNPASRRGTR